LVADASLKTSKMKLGPYQIIKIMFQEIKEHSRLMKVMKADLKDWKKNREPQMKIMVEKIKELCSHSVTK